MPTLHQSIAAKFLAALADSKEVDPDKIEQLRELLARGKKPKADDFIRVFTAPRGGEVK